MFQDLDQDLLANIFSFLPSGERGKAAHNLMNSSKHFYELFHQENCEVSQFNDYFREVFSSMYIPTIYCQLFLPKNANISEVMESMKDKIEILSENEFVMELDFTDLSVRPDAAYFYDLSIEMLSLEYWKENDYHNNATLTGKNMKLFENDTSIEVNIFRFFPKFKLHIMYRADGALKVIPDKCTSMKSLHSIEFMSISFPIYEEIVRNATAWFVEYTERYGIFELNQFYNEKEMGKLSKILSRGSSTELTDYFTIQKNLIHYFTNSFMANNTELIKYTSKLDSRYLYISTDQTNGLGIIENLSIIPWNVLSNNSRIKLATIFINHVFKDEINISDEFCSVYRQSQNETTDSNGNELKYFTHDDHIDIKFLTLQIRQTKSIIRNNTISIPSYPNVSMEKLSHTIPRKDILIIANKFDNFNTFCMKYCTFNTISAPLWLFPCWCWWGMIYSCICWTGPLCFKLPPNTSWTWLFTNCDISGLLDMESSCMSCLDPDVCLFVTLHGMCYLCCLPYRQIGATEPHFGSWSISEDKWNGMCDYDDNPSI